MNKTEHFNLIVKIPEDEEIKYIFKPKKKNFNSNIITEAISYSYVPIIFFVVAFTFLNQLRNLIIELFRGGSINIEPLIVSFVFTLITSIPAYFILADFFFRSTLYEAENYITTNKALYISKGEIGFFKIKREITKINFEDIIEVEEIKNLPNIIDNLMTERNSLSEVLSLNKIKLQYKTYEKSVLTFNTIEFSNINEQKKLFNFLKKHEAKNKIAIYKKNKQQNEDK